MIIKTEDPGFVKDLENNALLRNDIESLMKHRKLIKSKKSERDEINTLKKEISNIYNQLEEIKTLLLNKTE
tara:strand:- start:620 stop:832 length:213 start_codon:yes stop_codon:yes gene_type:complete